MKTKSRPHILVSIPVFFGAGAPVPRRLSIRKNSLPYFGQPNEEARKSFFWGLHGNNSRGGVLWELSRFGRVIRADVEYSVKEPPRSRPDHQVFAAGAADCMHLDRIAPAFADELHERWSADLFEKRRMTRAQLDKASLDDLTARYPEYVHSLFDEYPHVQAIVHMVHPTLPDATSSRTIPDPESLRCRVATCRANPKSILSAEIRFLPEVKIEL
jgi:hypothetical protein